MSIQYVRAKKHLGQHFLNDKVVAQNIVDALQANEKRVLEVGPGMGVLTDLILQRSDLDFEQCEIDFDSISYLLKKYPQLEQKIHEEDFLKMDLARLFKGESFDVIGNFPYNISSQIFFKVIEYKNQIPEVVGMVQKEVAERMAAPHGSKTYGILSVLLQRWYNIEYLFTVGPEVFIPPPKVQSAVVRLTRNDRLEMDCDEKLFIRVVKAAFNQRRKTMRNSLKIILGEKQAGEEAVDHPYFKLRPEQISILQFVELTNFIASQLKE